MRLVFIGCLLLVTVSSFEGDTTNYRREIISIMDKLISKEIGDGNFQHKGDVVYVSSGRTAQGFSVYSGGKSRSYKI